MAKTLPDQKVVLRPVEPGSDIEVGYEYAESDLQFSDSGLVAVCITGFAERGEGAQRFANIAAHVLHCSAYGVVPPYAQVAKMASNPRAALKDMAENSFRDVANELAKDRIVIFLANSLGGPLAFLAAAHLDSKAGVVSSAGMHNRLLGDTEPQRAAKLGKELLGTTTKQHILSGDWAVRHVLAGGLGDGATMKSRGIVGTGFVVSDEFQDMTVEGAKAVGESGVLAAPDRDACFWRDGYIRVLGAAGAKTLILSVAGPHACIRGKFFEAQLVPVLEQIAAQLNTPAK